MYTRGPDTGRGRVLTQRRGNGDDGAVADARKPRAHGTKPRGARGHALTPGARALSPGRMGLNASKCGDHTGVTPSVWRHSLLTKPYQVRPHTKRSYRGLPKYQA